jgi:hypothetical protein
VGSRVGALAVFVVVLAVGAFLGSALSQRWMPPDAAAGGVLPVRPFQGRVRVEVRNAGGRAGMARAATDQLREGGFDVVFYGNAASFDRDSSVVLDRVGRPDMARAVADALGIPRVLSQPDSNLYLDVTVELGEDWAPVPAAAEVEPAAELPWWDLRRWVGERGTTPSGPLVDPSPQDG